MMNKADTIWRVPAYLPYLQPPLTDEMIADAEEKIGFKLPSEYLELLRIQNGGYLRLTLPDMVHDTIAGIGPYFPSLTDFDWQEVQEYVSYPLEGLVPFDGDGHWHLCFDYRKDSTAPAVAHADIECDHETEIAASFSEYLQLLRVEAGDEQVLESVVDIDSVIARLSAELGVSFDPASDSAHGYPISRAALGAGGKPEWLWISPNRVPRGFVRTDDSRYEELKDLLPGEALRYPEIPDDSYILSATEGVRDRVLQACTRSNLVAKPLRDYL